MHQPITHSMSLFQCNKLYFVHYVRFEADKMYIFVHTPALAVCVCTQYTVYCTYSQTIRVVSQQCPNMGKCGKIRALIMSVHRYTRWNITILSIYSLVQVMRKIEHNHRHSECRMETPSTNRLNRAIFNGLRKGGICHRGHPYNGILWCIIPIRSNVQNVIF